MRAAALLAALLPGADPAPAGYTFPPEHRGDTTASLEVEVQGPAGAPGTARVRYTVTVEGGPGLEVEEPRLADPRNAWQARRASAWALVDGRVTWSEGLELEQTKPGVVPLPDVKVRFRDRPGAAWEEAEWADILGTIRDVPGPSRPPKPGGGPGRWAWAALAAAALAAGAGAAAWRRRSAAGRRPAPEEITRQELDRLEAEARAPGYDPAAFHTRLADAVRRYLAARFGLPAFQRTTAEYPASLGEAPGLVPAQRALLLDLLGRCDRARFAPAPADPEEGLRAARLARAFVDETAAGPAPARPR
jgi:hypothetical protein